MTIDCIPEQFKKTLEAIIQKSQEIIANEQLAPIVFLCKQGEISPVLLDFPDETGKDLSSMAIAQLAQQFRPEFTIFVSEAWVLKTDDASDIKRDKTQSLKHHPDRIDCIMYSLKTRYGVWMGTSEIKTGADGKRTAGIPEFMQPAKTMGRFANLLVGRGSIINSEWRA